MSDSEVKQQVRQFYDQVGWQLVAENQYQNARYEDLRPVSQEYIHRCHLRVNRFLKPSGRFLLDAGSGPVQYPEYLTYSQGYERRVCLDLSITALKEARKRLMDHGIYVVADISHLPFKSEAFDGLVSLHTLHHLPTSDQQTAYLDLHRVLSTNSSGVIVNGWTDSALMKSTGWLVRLCERIGARVAKKLVSPAKDSVSTNEPAAQIGKKEIPSTGTYIQKLNADWLRQQIGAHMKYEVWVWRSVNVRFLRAVIHKVTGGRFWLRLIYWLEESFPHFMGEKGQYPIIVIRK